MIDKEASLSKKQQKEKIRERYKGINPDILEVIPAKKRADFYDDVPRRVAIYVRVSTDDPRQTSSYELQKNYYEDMVQRHELWSLIEIFADEGISGTSLQHRDAFNRMVRECKAGKIDVLVVKSIDRLGRNYDEILEQWRIITDLYILSRILPSHKPQSWYQRFLRSIQLLRQPPHNLPMRRLVLPMCFLNPWRFFNIRRSFCFLPLCGLPA